MNPIKIGDTVVYRGGGREWTAEVLDISESLTVRTVSDSGDYSQPHELPLCDVTRVAAFEGKAP